MQISSTSIRLFAVLFLLSASNTIADVLDNKIQFFNYLAGELYTEKETRFELNKHSSFSERLGIRVNADIDSMALGKEFVVRLPNGADVSFTISKRKELRNGDLVIQGMPDKEGLIVFTFGKNSIFGTIEYEGAQYNIETTLGSGQTIGPDVSLECFDTSKMDFLRTESYVQIPLGDKGNTSRSSQLAKEGKKFQSPKIIATDQANSGAVTQIDLLVIYSPSVVEKFGSAETRINQMIAFTNAVYERSGILIELNLVHTYQTVFEESLGPIDLLYDVTYARSPFDNVRQIRDQYHADLVAVVGLYMGGGAGWINGYKAYDGYSVSVASDYTFAHELGHNLGSGHEYNEVNPYQSQPCRGGYTGYSCGYGNRNSGWGTIMSNLYNSTVGYIFSNPDMNCSGEPCGISEGQAGAADNRTSFNITRTLVAAFRSLGVDTPQNIQASDGSHKDKVLIAWDVSVGADGYEVYRCSDTSLSSCSYIAKTSDTLYTYEKVKESRVYYFRVKACIGQQCGDYSEYDRGSLKDDAMCFPISTNSDKVAVICL